MKPHEETWTVNSCGNPDHGPKWTCCRVKNEKGEVVLCRVDKATAERYATFPALARALIRRLSPEASPCVCHLTAPLTCNNCLDRAMLTKAGVLP